MRSAITEGTRGDIKDKGEGSKDEGDIQQKKKILEVLGVKGRPSLSPSPQWETLLNAKVHLRLKMVTSADHF